MWHRKLGHLSFGTTIKMLKSIGVTLTSINKASASCEFCQLKKAHKLSFLFAHDRVNSSFLLMHLYLWISTQLSLNNKRYFMSIVDESNRFICFFPLATKDQTSSTFLYFKSMAENNWLWILKWCKHIGVVSLNPWFRHLKKRMSCTDVSIHTPLRRMVW